MSDRNKPYEVIQVAGDQLLKTIRELVHQGNVRRIIIKNTEGHPLLEIPLTLGLVGAMLLPVWAAVGAVAALASGFTLEIEKVDEGGPRGAGEGGGTDA
ncbi:MAG TPA: DUF4342 domain-containing protein [Polyangia bacterium]|jgi:hypothetical protein|nr:DUF4342 domain-containing protein [Polyangia bacterium]